MRNVPHKNLEKIKRLILYSAFFPKIMAFMR